MEVETRSSTLVDETKTIAEYARWANVSRKTAYRHARGGIIPALKVGGRWVVVMDKLRARAA